MEDPLRLNRRRLIGAAGAVSLCGGLVGRVEAGGSGVVAPVSARFCFEARIRVAAPVRMADDIQGRRHLIAITGGEFEGPRIRGEVSPGGADYVVVRPDGITTVAARYGLRVADGTFIDVSNRGIVRHGAQPVVATAPSFEAPDGPHDWLNRGVFVAALDGSRAARGSVTLRVFEVG